MRLSTGWAEVEEKGPNELSSDMAITIESRCMPTSEVVFDDQYNVVEARSRPAGSRVK
jgi:hypothetical protein